MAEKFDVIEQARLSAYFADMQEEQFQEKLRRIVSISTIIQSNCFIIAHAHVFPMLNKSFSTCRDSNMYIYRTVRQSS